MIIYHIRNSRTKQVEFGTVLTWDCAVRHCLDKINNCNEKHFNSLYNEGKLSHGNLEMTISKLTVLSA